MRTNKPNAYTASDTFTALLFCFALIALILLCIIVPVTGTFIKSLYRQVSYLPTRYVGFDNFSFLFSNSQFIYAVFFTLIFTCTAVVSESIIGLIFALLLNRSFPGRTILRALVLIPWAIPTIISAKIWKLVFDYSDGILNYILLATHLSSAKINFFASVSSAFVAILAAEIWKTTPFMVIIFLAGLQAIPQHLYQQAIIDGSRQAKRFLTITLPLIKPILIVALIFRTIDSLRIFDLIFVLTGGGPGGQTKSITMVGFEYYSNDLFGKGSAVSVISFLLVMFITVLYLRVGNFYKQIQ